MSFDPQNQGAKVIMSNRAETPRDQEQREMTRRSQVIDFLQSEKNELPDFCLIWMMVLSPFLNSDDAPSSERRFAKIYCCG